jgi:hypothetical protein
MPLDNLDPADNFTEVETKIDATIDKVNEIDSIGMVAEQAETSTPKLKIARIAIGDWNMDASSAASVDIGTILGTFSEANAKKIYSVSSIIYPDAGFAGFEDGIGGSIDTLGVFDVLNFGGEWGIAATAPVSGGIAIAISRPDASLFNSVNYDSTSYNRGYITIIYEA